MFACAAPLPKPQWFKLRPKTCRIGIRLICRTWLTVRENVKTDSVLLFCFAIFCFMFCIDAFHINSRPTYNNSINLTKFVLHYKWTIEQSLQHLFDKKVHISYTKLILTRNQRRTSPIPYIFLLSYADIKLKQVSTDRSNDNSKTKLKTTTDYYSLKTKLNCFLK